MQLLKKIRDLFSQPLSKLLSDHQVSDIQSQLDRSLGMIRPAQNVQFGDYQANFAMPLKGLLKKNPQEIAQEVIDQADLSSLCSKVEIAGPGFINMTLKDDFLTDSGMQVSADPDLAFDLPENPRTVVVDYSSPNVAKPMHVGHIRSTVIGDALAKIHRALGHQVIADNHLGDWGTQFGMIIYGYRNFGDQELFNQNPVAELSRIYRLVRKIMDVLSKTDSIPKLKTEISGLQSEKQIAESALEAANSSGEKKQIKSAKKEVGNLNKKLADKQEELSEAENFVQNSEKDDDLMAKVKSHQNIATNVLTETSKLHAGDEDNLKFWKEILPHCHDEIDRIYSRLEISFDHQYGESFYHNQLAPLVEDLIERGLATESDGAICIFVDGFDAPMIVRKSDGAFLYATTDLATIEFRKKNWDPDAVLYVVDHRQSEHFDKLFMVGKKIGYESIDLNHVSFGTVMDQNGKPYKTRAGDTVGLEGLINEAVSKAHDVVCKLDDSKFDRESGQPIPDFNADQRKEIAEVIGTGALKFGDLSQNRTSDYKFDFAKMVALDGDTSAYIQYAYTRVNGILAKVDSDKDSVIGNVLPIKITNDRERSLLISILRFQDALEEVLVDYRPNLLCTYLISVAKEFSSFYNADECRVKDVKEDLQASRLKLCVLAARTMEKGLSLLGINVVQKM